MKSLRPLLAFLLLLPFWNPTATADEPTVSSVETATAPTTAAAPEPELNLSPLEDAQNMCSVAAQQCMQACEAAPDPSFVLQCSQTCICYYCFGDCF